MARNILNTKNIILQDLDLLGFSGKTGQGADDWVNGVSKSHQNPNFIIWRIVDVRPITDVPPLRMLINPASLAITMTHNNNETLTRGGIVTEHWGTELDSIAANGTTAMFYNRASNNTGKGGITNLNVRGTQGGDGKISKRSASYENFLRLIRIYKTNGVRYDFGVGPKANKRNTRTTLDNEGNVSSLEEVEKLIKEALSVRQVHVKLSNDFFSHNVAPGQKFPLAVGRVQMIYDGDVFWGYFENFNFTESGAKPFSFDYSFTFKVTQKIGELSITEGSRLNFEESLPQGSSNRNS